MKKVIIAIIALLILFAVGVLFIGRTYFPDNIAATSADGGKKGLKTRFYKSDVASATKVVLETIPAISTYGSSWKIVDETDGGEISSVKVEVPVVVFTDDLEVKIKKADNEQEVQVDVRSQSRVGKSDFGENARHVRKLLRALDEKLN